MLCVCVPQGINRLAAIALLYLEEEDAFWCLSAIIDSILPTDYYTATLLAAQVDQVLYNYMYMYLCKICAGLCELKYGYILIFFAN